MRYPICCGNWVMDAMLHRRAYRCGRCGREVTVAEWVTGQWPSTWQGPRRSAQLHPLVQLDARLREQGRKES
jgi:hypothetical protein